MTTYQSVIRERSCTNEGHHMRHGERHAEIVTKPRNDGNGVTTFSVIRCNACDRPTGLRLIRKAVTS